MKRQLVITKEIVILLIISTLFLLNAAPQQSNINELEIIEVPELEDLYINHTIDINIVFVGFDGYGIDASLWDNELPKWYQPLASLNYELFPMYYEYRYNYIYANKTTTNDFFSYLNTSWFTQPDPVPQHLVDWGFSSGDYINGVSAISMEEWLAREFNYLPGYTLILINSNDYITQWYSYTVDFSDPDTGSSQYKGYMNCWAGNNSLAFYDYSAPPADEGMSWGEKNNVTFVPTLYESWTGSEFDSTKINNDLIKVTTYTCELLFTPSYLYYPRPFDNYLFYYLLIDCTSDDYAYNNPLEFVDTSIIKDAYNYLIPTSNWNYKFLMMKLSSDSELQTKVNDNYEDYVSYGVLKATEGGINEYLENYWIDYEDETTKVLPAIFFVFDKTTWYDSGSETGGTVARANGKDGEGWEVVGCLDKSKTTGGSTALSTHEAGHFVGLRHPHDGWSWDSYLDTGYGEVCYWLWDYQATTMTYSYNYPYFNRLNKMQLYRGQMLMHLNKTYYNMIEAYEILALKSYTIEPYEFAFKLGELSEALINTNMSMHSYDYVSAKLFAERTEIYSEELIGIANNLDIAPDETTTVTETETIVNTETITVNNTITETQTAEGSSALLGLISIAPLALIVYRRKKRKK
ncbi:MAG: hypothetical protein ACTSQE_13505 [Candidatus Heimdallarchaeaceae archaeon]